MISRLNGILDVTLFPSENPNGINVQFKPLENLIQNQSLNYLIHLCANSCLFQTGEKELLEAERFLEIEAKYCKSGFF